MKSNRTLTPLSSLQRQVVAVEDLMRECVQYLVSAEASLQAIEAWVKAALEVRDTEINLLLRAALRERHSVSKNRTTENLVRTLMQRLEMPEEGKAHHARL